MKNILLNTLMLSLMFSFLHSENLSEKYKRMMDGKQNIPEEVMSFSDEKSSVDRSKDIDFQLKIIQNMKKNTFESSNEFQIRRNEKITEFEKNNTFYFANGSREYSAGTVEMKHYNPDTEIMTLNLLWNPDVTALLSETRTIKTVSFMIPREEAKTLFAKKEKHFFHIKTTYISNKPTISEILLYNKYSLYRNINTKVATAIRKTPVQNVSKKTTLECKKYRVVASTLNIRNEPSRQSKILGSVQKGDTVCIYEFYDGWSRSKYGWISQKYIKKNRTPSHNKPSEKKEKPSSEHATDSSDSNFWVWIVLIILAIVFFR